ncbi:MAG TPA: precorrin-2 C(20)-methyltransferase [Mycobacteriales bacterium]|nr:precorrin-2 C(20)-methyltransferase [Mycobacteriales bacterium]
MNPPRLIGVGVGPGDPELITVKAVRVLRAADVVFVPVMATGELGRAEATVRAHVEPGRLRRAVFALGDGHDRGRRHAAWEAAADAVAAAFRDAATTVAFATIGDPNLYSTFSYLADAVRDRLPDTMVETVPGITAMQALAAASGTVLCEGTESLALLPLTAGMEAFETALDRFDTVVAYKGGAVLPELLALLRAHGRLDDAVYGAALGLPTEDVRPARDVPDGPGPYLSTVLVPPRRGDR